MTPSMTCHNLLKYTLFFSILMFFYACDVAADKAQPSEKIPDSIISLSTGFVVTVDKKDQKLFVFKKSNNSFKKVYTATCSTGKNQGGKEMPGDAKTPNGIFFATRMIPDPGPPETYGTLAYHLDFPSTADKKAGRNGTNIWIHGTTKPLSPFQTNGCVVLTDEDIHILSRYISINKTPVIIAESIRWVNQNQPPAVKTELEKVLSDWTKAYAQGNLEAIDALYLEGHRINDKKREILSQRLAAVKNISQHFILEPRDVSILQYADHAVILFDQITSIQNNNLFEGAFQKLALQKINHQWFAIDDRDSISVPEIKPETPVVVTQAIDAKNEEAVRKLIAKWSGSWQSGNMNTYSSCYTTHFRSQGMNLNNWVDHKIKIRKRSKNISVRISNVHISGNNNEATATLTQHYSSSLLNRKGDKKLELRKINGEWKIYRETMI